MAPVATPSLPLNSNRDSSLSLYVNRTSSREMPLADASMAMGGAPAYTELRKPNNSSAAAFRRNVNMKKLLDQMGEAHGDERIHRSRRITNLGGHDLMLVIRRLPVAEDRLQLVERAAPGRQPRVEMLGLEIDDHAVVPGGRHFGGRLIGDGGE